MAGQRVFSKKLVFYGKCHKGKRPVPAARNHVVVFPEETGEKIGGKHVADAMKSLLCELVPSDDHQVVIGIFQR